MLSVSATLEPPPQEADEPSIDGYPELATNDHWRATMRRARDAADMTQAQLGARIGFSQNAISKIESGEQKSSKAVMPICHVLKILPPMILIADELDQRWHDSGRKIRGQDPDFFAAQVEGMERLAATLAEKRRQ
jgi:transcriptional regulator with XRE-family HTH domain